MWTFSVSELALPGAEVGRVSATDADVGENARLEFTISDGDGGEMFNITGLNQEGVIILNQVNARVKQSITVICLTEIEQKGLVGSKCVCVFWSVHCISKNF